MTTDLEKQFYTTFGIEPFIYCSKPRLDCDARSKGACRKDCEYYSGVLYPEITDRILLELICIIASNPIRILFEAMLSGIKEVELLKNSILLTCIANKDSIKLQVRTLFKEE